MSLELITAHYPTFSQIYSLPNRMQLIERLGIFYNPALSRNPGIHSCFFVRRLHLPSRITSPCKRGQYSFLFRI